MKLKKVLTLLASAGVTLSLAACGGATEPAGSAESNAPAAEASADGGAKAEGDTFTVGFDANFPPYGYKEGDEYVGFDLDLAAEVANRNGWELVKQPIDWDSKDMELNAGTIDVLWNGFTINGREDKYAWSKPYVDSSIVIVVRGDSGIETAADLAGKVVLVQADSSGKAALDEAENADLKASFADLTEVPDYNNAFMTLEAGAADAVVVDQSVAKQQMAARDEGAFMELAEPLRSEQYGIGFKLGNEALRDQVQTSLDEMVKDGTFMKIAEKYDLQDAVITE